MYTLKIENKNKIKNLIKEIKKSKNHIRNTELEIIQEIRERFNTNTNENEIILENKIKFIDKFIKFLIYWYKKETL